MNMKLIVLCASLMLSSTVVAQEIAVFYLRQIPGDLESFMLFSDGRGLSSQIVSGEERQVSVEKQVFIDLWSRFPSAAIAPYSLPESDKTKIHALNNYVLKIQRIEEGKRVESNYMVPHGEAPEKVIAWIAKFLQVFGDQSGSVQAELER